jgi:hypothetical protein
MTTTTDNTPKLSKTPKIPKSIHPRQHHLPYIGTLLACRSSLSNTGGESTPLLLCTTLETPL